MIRKVHISRLAVPGGTGLLSGSLPLRRFSSRLSRSFMAFKPARGGRHAKTKEISDKIHGDRLISRMVRRDLWKKKTGSEAGSSGRAVL